MLTRRQSLTLGTAAVFAPLLPFPALAAPQADWGSIEYLPEVTSAHVGPRAVTLWQPPADVVPLDEPLPVIVAQDGGNLFDAAASYSGTAWELDRAMQAHIEKGGQAARIVAVHSGAARSMEYNSETVLAALDGEMADLVLRSCEGPLASNAYLRFLAEELLPMAAGRMALAQGPAMILGASMGGTIAVEALMTRPDVFAAGAALSAHLVLFGPASQAPDFGPFPEDGGKRLAAAWRKAAAAHFPAPGGTRLWLDRGTEDLDAFYPDSHIALTESLLAKGYVAGDDLMVRVDKGAGHFETFWQARLPAVLDFLLPAKG
ncbi:alpha/beta hydrolase [Neogemmobacter tilapiae]|uniref:Esterase n=1 Tax=Neogemmobacter tilapiae TaxID=875041 RepID=A0A918TYF7_9RHOB|nr:alpha/beta hydrolase-fold protein [Gemmobacter tilapiae]GHC62310.1 esterase [Gemmobacter tilapiae]